MLLAELYCSLLLRRRKLRNTNTNTIPAAATQTTTTANASSSPSHTSQPQQHPPPPPPPPPPFSSIYAQGVLQAPRSFLLPAVACKEDIAAEPNKLHSVLHQVVQIQTQESNASPHHVGVLSSSSPSTPPASFLSKAPPKPSQEDPLQGITHCSGGGEHLVYISNPIYESKASGADTPFETPDTSPSRLERSGSSGEDDAAHEQSPCGTRSPPYTPPLTPMKKLPAEACSVSLRDARSLDTSASDSRSINGPFSSSSGSPCTSPSW